MTNQSARVPTLDAGGRFPDRFAPPSVAQAVLDAASHRDAAAGSATAADASAQAASASAAIVGPKVEASKLQSVLLAEAMRKLRKNEAVKLVARGDSTTYGHDTVSADIIPAPTDTLPDGSKHSFTRSPKPWPAALQDCLNTGYGVTNIAVENQGYSGDWVKRGYERWLNNVDADITVISYGINDASASYVPDDMRGNLTQFLEWTEKMVLRDLAWGSAVVFMTPTRQLGQAGNLNTDSYRNALQSLASKYGIPIIDGEAFLATQARDAWSDGNHLTTKGNFVMGARMAAVFLSESPLAPARVTNGSKLLTRPTMDGFVKHPLAVYSNSSGYPTPADNVNGSGTAITISAAGSQALWSFYTDQPDVMVFPSAYLAGVAGETGLSAQFILDFGADAGDDYNDRAVGDATPDFVSAPNSVTLGPVVGAVTLYNDHVKGAAPVALRVPTAGWHTIRAVATTSTTSTVYVHNLEFFGYRSWANTRELVTASASATSALAASGVKGSYLKADPAAFNETADILTTRVPWPDVLAAVYGKVWNSDYYTFPPMRITVTSYTGAVMEYLFLASLRSDIVQADVTNWPVDAAGGSGASRINVLKLLSTTMLGAGTAGTNTGVRLLESISYAGATKELILNWKTTMDDGTARAMKKNFNVAFTVI